MKIYHPEMWSRVPGVDYGAASISLSSVLPKAGQSRSALFSIHANMPVGEVVSILWKPPMSALNGWSEQPSEITQSFLVSAKLVRAAAHDHHLNKYDLDIVSNEALLPRLRSQRLKRNDEWALPKVVDTSTNPCKVFLTWDEVAWCGVANISGLTYLAASSRSEGHMELIVDEVKGELYGLFSANRDPGGSWCDLGLRKLSRRECHAVRKAKATAVQLVDTIRQYLVT